MFEIKTCIRLETYIYIYTYIYIQYYNYNFLFIFFHFVSNFCSRFRFVTQCRLSPTVLGHIRGGWLRASRWMPREKIHSIHRGRCFSIWCWPHQGGRSMVSGDHRRRDGVGSSKTHLWRRPRKVRMTESEIHWTCQYCPIFIYATATCVFLHITVMCFL